MLKIAVLGGAALQVSAFAIQGSLGAGRAGLRASAPTMAGFFDFSATALDGKETAMDSFKGKPTLILNVASL